MLTEGGPGALSMRAVARELGVAPNALYSHVRNRDDLIDRLLDDALGEVAAASVARGPRRGLTQIMTNSYDALSRRHALVPLYLGRQGARGPNAVALGTKMDVLLTAAGLDETAVPRARHALIVAAIGWAAYDAHATDPAAARSAFLDALGWLLDGILKPSPRTRSRESP